MNLKLKIQFLLFSTILCLSMIHLSAVAQGGSKSYTVTSMDTYFSIANKFKVTVNDLKAANNNEALTVGQQLKIPKSSVQPPAKSKSKGYRIFRHKPGESEFTLSELERYSKLSVKEIKKGLDARNFISYKETGAAPNDVYYGYIFIKPYPRIVILGKSTNVISYFFGSDDLYANMKGALSKPPYKLVTSFVGPQKKYESKDYTVLLTAKKTKEKDAEHCLTIAHN